MKRLKLERVTGLIGLSYLVLIPAAGIFLWNRHILLQQEVESVWHYLDDTKKQNATERS